MQRQDKDTASRKDIYLVLVYGITEHPMMLATNKKISSKEDAIRVAKLSFSRWRIEEYFRCKKQVFRFENFRVHFCYYRLAKSIRAGYNRTYLLKLPSCVFA